MNKKIEDMNLNELDEFYNEYYESLLKKSPDGTDQVYVFNKDKFTYEISLTPRISIINLSHDFYIKKYPKVHPLSKKQYKKVDWITFRPIKFINIEEKIWLKPYIEYFVKSIEISVKNYLKEQNLIDQNDDE